MTIFVEFYNFPIFLKTVIDSQQQKLSAIFDLIKCQRSAAIINIFIGVIALLKMTFLLSF